MFRFHLAQTYSIAYGLIAGIAIWIVLQSVFWLLGFLGVERPSFEEDDVPNLRKEMEDKSKTDKQAEGDGSSEEQASDDAKKTDDEAAEESPVEGAASEQEDA